MSSTPRGRLICFEGLDGAGKTTLSERVAQGLEEQGTRVRLMYRKDATFPTPGLSKRMALLKHLIWEYGELPLQEFGDEHALYNMASWFSVLDRCKIRPLLDEGVTVVIDNWYYKFISRFRIKPGLDFAHVRRCFAHLTSPDAVIFLDVTPSIAAQRKQDFSRGECGNFDGLTGLTRENFIRYQESVRGGLMELAREGQWLIFPVDDRSSDQVTASILARLRDVPPRASVSATLAR